MNIFIDAYNLLKQLHGATQVSEQQRDAFLDRLRRFTQLKRHHIYLVYDGGPASRSESERLGLVTVIHSGYTLTADDIIKRKILSFAQEHTILVSDDRQLCDYVSAAGFATLGTLNFYTVLKSALHKEQAACAQHGVAHKHPDYMSTAELDKLMQYASTVGYYKEEGTVFESDNVKKASKSEKKLKKLARKL